MKNNLFKFTILSPLETILDEEVKKISLKGKEGSYSIFPNHLDYISSIKTNVLYYVDKHNKTYYVAINEGILVKCGNHVKLSVFSGIKGTDIKELEKKIAENIRQAEEAKKAYITSVTNLEYFVFDQLMNFKRFK